MNMKSDDELANIIFELANEARIKAIIDIPRFIQFREIKSLFHFTSIHNLLSIAQHGLLGRNSLIEAGIETRFTDTWRVEPIQDAVCFSISNPNYYMAANKISAGHELVLLELPNVSEILSTHNFVVLPGNFGTVGLKKQMQNWPEKFIGGEGLLNLFKEQAIRTKYKLPIHEPTDPQSEILILQPLDSKYIKNVYSPSGKNYAEQSEIRKLTKSLPKHWTFNSQIQEVFPKIDWGTKGTEFNERKWTPNWS